MKREKPMKRRTAVLIVAAFLVAVWLITWLVMSWALEEVEATPRPDTATCFPAKSWDGQQGKRPCVTVYDLAKNGSANIYLEHADIARRRWSCKVPATGKRTPRRFKVTCKRIPRAGLVPPWVERKSR